MSEKIIDVGDGRIDPPRYPIKMRKALGFLLLLIAVLGLSALRFRKGSTERLHSQTKFLMGTLVEVRVAGRGGRAEEAIEAAFGEMKRIDSLASRTKEGEISLLNRNGGGKVSPDVSEMVKRSIQYGVLTHGAFDPTVYPLLRHWSYFEDDGVPIPLGEELMDILPLVNHRGIEVKDCLVTFRKKGMGLDLGGIAKGYALDRAAQVLTELGVTSALVEAGGDIRVVGEKADGSPWRIGLRHPREDGILTTFELCDKSICTSGDYERYFERDGVRYHHILDPGTGYPARGCCSVTIVADDATTADALATGVFVLGPEKGMALIDSLKGVEGVIVSERDGELEIRVSSGLQGKLTFSP